MKMMAMIENEMCDRDLRMAKICLNACLERMKGKYGTAKAVANLKCAMIYINPCISDDKYYTNFYQQFRNPPNTPKSRRLGWHRERRVAMK